jgi:plastocyanin
VENTATSSSKRLISALVFVVLGVAVVSSVGLTLHKLSADPQKPLYATKSSQDIVVDGKSYPKATIELGVYPDKETAAKHGYAANRHDYVQYGPSSHLILPAHTYVTMTIKAYDSGEQLNNPYFGKVVGTVGGTMNVDGTDVTSIPSDNVQHTFTLHGIPSSSQDPLFVNIPLPQVKTNEKGDPIPTDDPATKGEGHTVTFSFITGGAGEYVWNCEYPCGDGSYAKFGAAMSAYGYMSGKVTVK